MTSQERLSARRMVSSRKWLLGQGSLSLSSHRLSIETIQRVGILLMRILTFPILGPLNLSST
jgi:hypothetical protein